MRPKLRLLEDGLIERIVTEARDVLRRLGVAVENRQARDLLADHGAKVDPGTNRVRIGDDLVERALEAVPASFALFDSVGEPAVDFSDGLVHFTPGSAAIHVLDGSTGEIRRPLTGDYVRYAKLVSGLPGIETQSTAFIPADVHESVSDSYRLYLSLVHCEKPVVTGAFTAEAFPLMRELLLAVRGSDQALRSRPLAVFTCCPTAPLRWSEATSQNLLDCARSGVPVEIVSVPLAGFMSPVTLVGTLIQHCAENLSGVVLAQLAAPGAPLLWGGSPAVFDVRHETTPMGAVETMMLDCANAEIGRRLGMPTQGYLALSDSKALDAQAGLETSMGATLAALAGVSNVSGPGMLEFENCQSLDKLVVDHEVCLSVRRLARGIEPRGDFPAIPLLEELLRESHLLIARHTRRHLREEIGFPGPVIDRSPLARWRAEGGATLDQRVRAEVERVVALHVPPRVPEGARAELQRIMASAAQRAGMEALPAVTA